MIMNKKQSRLRRAKKIRATIKQNGLYRLTVYKTVKHIYAQLFHVKSGHVICSASTLEKSLNIQNGSNIESAMIIGEKIAERSISLGITTIGFDRSGFKYHGRIKALADSARKKGLLF